MKRRDEVLVGAFTTAAILVMVLGAIWLVRGGLSKGYPLYSRYSWGSGLKQGQPVWLSGVTVGFVDDVALDPNGSLVVTYRIQNKYKVPKGTTSQIVPNGLFGDQAIALTPTVPNDTSFAPGDTVPIGLSPVGVSALLARADTMTRTLNSIVKATSTQLTDSGGLADLRRMFTQSARLAAQLNDIAAVQSKELQLTLASFRRSANAIDSLQVDSTVRSLRATSANAAELTADLRSTTAKVNTLLAKLDKTDGTAGKLLNDPTLYNDLRALLNRVDSLTADFKKNPRRYIDLRIF